MAMIDIASLRVFIAVATSSSFTQAALLIGRTQSAITQQIQSMESLLERQLIMRGKNLSMTPDGEILYEYAQKIVALHDDMMSRLKEPYLEGVVRFGLPEDFAAMLLSRTLSYFSRHNPRIKLDIECDLTINLLHKFEQGYFDIILTKTNVEAQFGNKSEILSERLYWVGLNKLAKRRDVVPLVLAPEPCVYRRQALKALSDAGIASRIILSTQSFTSTIAAVKAGMGIAVLSSSMIPSDVNIIDDETLPRLSDVHISILKRKNCDECVNSLRDFIYRTFRVKD